MFIDLSNKVLTKKKNKCPADVVCKKETHVFFSLFRSYHSE